jgi:16S rRNA C1402 N4-methylase RsmH
MGDSTDYTAIPLVLRLHITAKELQQNLSDEQLLSLFKTKIEMSFKTERNRVIVEANKIDPFLTVPWLKETIR